MLRQLVVRAGPRLAAQAPRTAQLATMATTAMCKEHSSSGRLVNSHSNVANSRSTVHLRHASRSAVAHAQPRSAARNTQTSTRFTPLLVSRIGAFEHIGAGSALALRSFSSEAGSVVQFKLADVGEGIAECEVLKWYVAEGQPIAQFQKLCEVQSDKATVEITSRFDGVVKRLHYNVGDMARVGSALVDIELADDGSASSNESSDADVAQDEASAAHPVAAQESFQSHGKVLATPAVRRIASENNIDLTQVQATGKDGRVTKQDVLDFISSGGRSNRVDTAKEVVAATEAAKLSRSAAAAAAPAPSGAAVAACGGKVPPPLPPAPAGLVGEDKEITIRGIQKIMVKTMTAATNVPHFGYCDEIELDKLMAAREQLKPIAESRGIRLSYMPLMLKALSVALRAYPILNSHTNPDCTAYIQRARHNIGVAMDTPTGLLVPNIKDVQSRTVFEIAQELNRLQALGKQGKLSTDDLSGGTFTLSNIGVIGGTYASPVLFLPEVAIGALGKVQKLPRYDESGNVRPVHIANISWAADHRIIDGATMARFSNTWKELLENPALLLSELR